MKGKILDYNFQESRGIISADDGNRYSFENSQWKGTQSPKVNQIVDFEIDGQNAKDIYLDKSTMNFDEVKDKLVEINAQEKVNEVKYKFIPSAELNKVVIDTINNKLNLLEDTLEKSLVEKVTKVYKDLI